MWQTILAVLAVQIAAPVAAAATDAAPPKSAEPTEFRLTLDLSDGSHLIGAAAIDGLDVETLYGKAHLKWVDIRSVEWKTGDRNGRFDMQNGDSVGGRVAQETLDFKTLVGVVGIPIGTIRRLSVVGPVAAKTAFSLRFDGRQNFVTVPNDAALDPTDAMTLECWFKTKANRCEILGKRKWPANQWPSPDDHGYQIHVDAGILCAYWEGRGLMGRRVADGEWHHAAMTWDGATRRLFQDGVMVAEDKPGTWIPANTELRIGSADGSHAQVDFFEGTLSGVRLSKTDRYHGQNFTPPLRFTADADTVACWDFTEGAGSLLRDCSGHGHDGTLTGDPPPEWVMEAPTAVPQKPPASVWR